MTSRKPQTLDEALQRAIVASDFYNRPDDRRNFAEFLVHNYLVWQDMFHVERMRRNVEILYRKNGSLCTEEPFGSPCVTKPRDRLSLKRWDPVSTMLRRSHTTSLGSTPPTGNHFPIQH